MFGLAHGTMLFAPSENTFDHRPARFQTCHSLDRRMVRSSMALLRVLPVLVTAWFCVTCVPRADGAKIRDMIGRIHTPCPHRP